MRPNLVIIGAQKAATTSLWLYLGQHPSVFMSPIKETNFFVAEMGWSRGIAWYESLFEPAVEEGAEVIGEASPNYTLFPSLPGVPERMASVIPNARLVYLLRHPIERMISSYMQELAQGTETMPIARALLERPHYADASRYAMQIDQYLRHFERSQLLILLSEELEREPEGVLDRALSFLGLPAGWRPTDLGARHNPSRSKRVPRGWWRRLGGLMIRGRIPTFPVPEAATRSPLTTRALKPEDITVPDDARKRLEDSLRPDVERLRTYLGRDFDGWGLI